VDGKGTVDPPVEPADEGLAVGKLKAGVSFGSGGIGEDKPEGVEACSVANKLGVGEEAIGRLQPSNKKRKQIVEKSLSLVIIQFNGLYIKFFTG